MAPPPAPAPNAPPGAPPPGAIIVAAPPPYHYYGPPPPAYDYYSYQPYQQQGPPPPPPQQQHQQSHPYPPPPPPPPPPQMQAYSYAVPPPPPPPQGAKYCCVAVTAPPPPPQQQPVYYRYAAAAAGPPPPRNSFQQPQPQPHHRKNNEKPLASPSGAKKRAATENTTTSDSKPQLLQQPAAWKRKLLHNTTNSRKNTAIATTKKPTTTAASTRMGSTDADAAAVDEAVWNRNYQRLRAFHREHGHCRVPVDLLKVDDDSSSSFQRLLGLWVQDQKKHYANYFKGKPDADITIQRIAKFDALGNFLESSGARAAVSQHNNTGSESRWTHMFHRLCEYRREHGHTRVPGNYQIGTDDRLGQWCSSQRRHYKHWMEGKAVDDAALTRERIDLLRSIGFDWTAPAAGRGPLDTWNRNFELLRAYHREHGHCRVPESCVVQGDVKLGRWVQNLRSRYTKMVEDGRATDGETLTQQRVAKLRSVDFASSCRPIQDFLDEEWGKKFEMLRDYQRRHGHSRVPQRYSTEGGCKLGRWVADQRRSYNNLKSGRSYKASITQERIDKLNSIQFEWRCGGGGGDDDDDDKDGGVRGWDQKFDLLLAYKLEHGHVRVPSKYEVNRVKLGQWVSDQRKFAKRRAEGRKNALISQERIDKLTAVGFEWEMVSTAATTATRSKRGSSHGPAVATATTTADDDDGDNNGNAEQIDELNNSIDFDWTTPPNNGQQQPRVTGV